MRQQIRETERSLCVVPQTKGWPVTACVGAGHELLVPPERTHRSAHLQYMQVLLTS